MESMYMQTDEGSQLRCFSHRSQSLLASVRLHGLTVNISTNHRPVRMMRAQSANLTPRIRVFSKGAYFSCQFNYKPTSNSPDTLCNNVRRLFETPRHHVKVLVLCKQPGCVFRNVFVGKSHQWRVEEARLATEEDAVAPGYDRHSLSFRAID